MSEIAFSHDGDYLDFIEHTLTRREVQVFKMLEGHLKRLDPDPTPRIVVTEDGDGEVTVDALGLNDLERIGLLARGLAFEALGYFDEEDE